MVTERSGASARWLTSSFKTRAQSPFEESDPVENIFPWRFNKVISSDVLRYDCRAETLTDLADDFHGRLSRGGIRERNDTLRSSTDTTSGRLRELKCPDHFPERD